MCEQCVCLCESVRLLYICVCSVRTRWVCCELCVRNVDGLCWLMCACADLLPHHHIPSTHQTIYIKLFFCIFTRLKILRDSVMVTTKVIGCKQFCGFVWHTPDSKVWGIEPKAKWNFFKPNPRFLSPISSPEFFRMNRTKSIMKTSSKQVQCSVLRFWLSVLVSMQCLIYKAVFENMRKLIKISQKQDKSKKKESTKQKNSLFP